MTLFWAAREAKGRKSGPIVEWKLKRASGSRGKMTSNEYEDMSDLYWYIWNFDMATQVELGRCASVAWHYAKATAVIGFWRHTRMIVHVPSQTELFQKRNDRIWKGKRRKFSNKVVSVLTRIDLIVFYNGRYWNNRLGWRNDTCPPNRCFTGRKGVTTPSSKPAAYSCLLTSALRSISKCSVLLQTPWIYVLRFFSGVLRETMLGLWKFFFFYQIKEILSVIKTAAIRK